MTNFRDDEGSDVADKFFMQDIILRFVATIVSDAERNFFPVPSSHILFGCLRGGRIRKKNFHTPRLFSLDT
jgi:hypothetical protein